MRMLVLVTGGTGFVGRAAVRALLDRSDPPRVRVLTRQPGRAAPRMRGLDVELVAGDVLEPSTLPAAFAGVDAVVNCVQFPGYPVEAPRRGLTFDRYDRAGTEEQARAAVAAGVARFVYMSGMFADPRSDKPWYRAKGLAEQALRALPLSWTFVRGSWAYGPDDNSLNRFAAIARRSPILPVVGDGSQRLQPVLADDLGRVLAEAALQPPGGLSDGRVIQAGGPEVVTMDEILRAMLDAMGLRRPLVHVSPALPKLAGAVLAALLPRPPLNAQAVDFLTAEVVTDLTALRETLDVPLTPLREGLAYLRR